MNDLRQTRVIETYGKAAEQADGPVAVRVSPHAYFNVLFLATFVSALFFYLKSDTLAFIVLGLAWTTIPFLAFNDKIVFDGRTLERTGLLPRFWFCLNSMRRRMKIKDIEQVETQSARTLKRGGTVSYRFRTSIRGKGQTFVLVSGRSDGYRKMIRALLSKLDEDVLDTRSIELRDHLVDPKEAQIKAEFSRIPSSEALTDLFHDIKVSTKQNAINIENEDDKADELRQLANELLVSGSLTRALEAFRRAILLKPNDGWLMFEFARCLHAFAGVKRDPKLKRRALAALRLSERRGSTDAKLLSRIGEWYFQIGEFERARMLFHAVRDRVGESFRSAVGLAELALREGKIAHVIHHFAAANRIASTVALRRWAKNETDYFTKLNEDEEYLELEISRVNLLESVDGSKKTALRIAFLAFPIVIIGVIFDDVFIANIGWAISTVSLLIWIGLGITARMLGQRIPYELMSKDD